MTSFPARSVFWLGLTALVAITPFGANVHGQVGTQQLGNSAELTKAYDLVKGAKFFNQISGKDAKPDAGVIDTVAKFHIYRNTWPQGPQNSVVDFNRDIDRILSFKNSNKEFVDAFAPAVVKRARELTNLSLVENAQAVLNGVQIFPALAKLRHESTSAYFLELMAVPDEKNPGQDAIRLWALRGLREFFPVVPWGEGTFDFSGKENLARKAADLARVNALVKFIERKPPAKATPEELAAFVYLRREAIETLALGGYPAVNAFRKYPTAEGVIAPVLLKVLVPGSLVPPPTLAERNEAALGLCQVKAVDEYIPAPTVYFVGKTFLEVAKEYGADFPNIRLGKDRPIPTAFHWKITPKRWEQALAAYASTRGLKPAVALQSQASDLLKKMQSSETLGNLLNLEKSIEALAPPPGPIQLFKTIKADPVKWQGKDAEAGGS